MTMEDAYDSLEALCSFFYYLAKNNVKDSSFDKIYEECKLNTNFKGSMLKIFQNKKADIRKALGIEEDEDELHFKDLHWRVELEVASKAKASPVALKYLLSLQLEQHKKPLGLALECNYANMKRLKEELQNAVASVNMSYGRKIQRYAK